MKRQIHVKQIRQIQRQRHEPETAPESETGDGKSRKKSSGQKADRSRDSVDGSLLAQGESESALRAGRQHEGNRELSKLRLRKTVEKQKRHRADGAFPRKKTPEGFQKSASGSAFRRDGPLRGRGGEKMIEKQKKQNGGDGGHRIDPGGGGTISRLLEAARQQDKSALSGKHGAFVENVAESGARRLIVRGESQHIVAVRRDVVGRGDECREKKKTHNQRKRRMFRLKRQCRCRETESEDKLRTQHPRAFGPSGIQKRRPEKLETPGQSDDARPERHGTVRHPQRREDHHGDRGRHGKRQTLRKVDPGNPEPSAGAGECVHRAAPSMVRKSLRRPFRSSSNRRNGKGSSQRAGAASAVTRPSETGRIPW